MSTFCAPIVEVKLEKHPNADLLSVATVKGWQCVVRKADFENEAMGVYIPIDSVAAQDHPLLSFLHGKRVKTEKLRGILSQGILLPLNKVKETYSLINVSLGDDLHEILELKKYVPPDVLENLFGARQIPVAPLVETHEDFDKYTDIENIKNFPNAFQEGEDVYISEKLHGTSSRLGFIGDKLYIGTRNTNLKVNVGVKYQTIWHKVFAKEDIDKKIIEMSLSFERDVIVYGEIVGKGIQDLDYGYTEPTFYVYDLKFRSLETGQMIYLNYDELVPIVETFGLKLVPFLYRGPYSKELLDLRFGKNTISNTHIREGIVIKSIPERFDSGLGRVVLKSVSEDYLLRKNPKDR
jgi:RNA ligase (TIGR02306 family)